MFPNQNKLPISSAVNILQGQSLRVAAAPHQQPLPVVQSSNFQQAVPTQVQVANKVPQFRGFSPQSAPGRIFQPQPTVGQNLINKYGSPYGINTQTLSSVGSLADQYNYDHPAQTIPGQLTRLPPYKDLSGRQHASSPLSMNGAAYHIPGQGLVTNALHWIF